jgi:hypothetical protein
MIGKSSGHSLFHIDSVDSLHAYYTTVWLQLSSSPENACSRVSRLIKMQIVYLRFCCKSGHTEVCRPYIHGWSKFPAWSSSVVKRLAKWKPLLPLPSEIRVLSHVLRNKSSLFGCQKLHLPLSFCALSHPGLLPSLLFLLLHFFPFSFQGPDYLPELGVLRVRKKW